MQPDGGDAGGGGACNDNNNNWMLVLEVMGLFLIQILIW